MNKTTKITNNWHRITLVVALCLFGFCLMWAMTAPRTKKKKQNTDERVYLVHADELLYGDYSDRIGAQKLRGKVHFTHLGSQLWCDSAYFKRQIM